MKPTMDDVHVVLARFEDSEWDELRIEADDFRLHVCKSPRTERSTLPSTAPAPAPAPTVEAERSDQTVKAEASPDAAAVPPAAPGSSLPDGVVVTAPSLGTFYRASGPGADPYVEVGAEVQAGTQLCLLEVMKLYTAVEAKVAGVVVEVLVEDGGLVEHGQPLFVIRPHEA